MMMRAVCVCQSLRVIFYKRYVVCFRVDLVHFEQNSVLVRVMLHHVIVHLNSDADGLVGQ